MCHHRDTCLYDGLDTIGILYATLQFHGLTVGFLHNTSRIAHGIFHRSLIRHKRHINHHESLLGASAYGLTMMNHIIDGNSKCVFVTQHDIPQRIAYENHVNTRLIHDTGSVVIVSRQHAHGLLSFTIQQIKNGCFHFLY